MNTIKLKETTRLFRFINFAVDLLAAAAIFVLLVNIGGNFLDIRMLSEYEVKGYYLLVLFVYYLICESLFGRTLGKLLTRTKVVTRDLQRVPFGKILLRTLIRFVPLAPLTGFLYPWHDVWTDTKVIDLK